MKPLGRLTGGSVETFRLIQASVVVAAVVAQYVLGRMGPGGAQYLVLAISAALALSLWWLNESRSATIKSAGEMARGETLLDLGHILEPLTRELGRVASLSKPARRLERGSLRQAVLGAATSLSDTKLRASYFELNAAGDEMTCVRTTGRAVAPKAGFKAGVLSGDTALKMVRQGEHLFCDDTELSPPPGWTPSNNREYQTFISVTVGTPGRPAGMMTLDAPNAGDLTNEDVKMLLVLGHVLGVAEEITR